MSWIHLVYVALLGSSLFLYPSGSSEVVILFGNLAKIFSLLIAGLSLTSTQNAYAPGDTPQKAWTFLAAGMWIWFFAQVLFGFYKIVLNQSPYPSLADLFFVIAYFPLLAGVILLIKDFRSTGLPMGTAKSYGIQAAVLLTVYAIIFVTLLNKFLANDDPSLMKFLNVGYPTFDFLLISMTSVLVRISWTLRGGSLARSWILLCLGFVIIGTADIFFAYNPQPWVDILFFSAYFLIALAGEYQIRMLRH